MLRTLSQNSTDATQNIPNRAIDTQLIPPLHQKQSLGQPLSMDDIALLQESDGNLRPLVADSYSQFMVCSSHAIGGMC